MAYRDPHCAFSGDPRHTCRRRDGTPLNGRNGDCWHTARREALRDQPVEQLAYSIPQAAAALGVSPGLVRRLVNAGQLPARHVGNRIVIYRRRLEEWLATDDARSAS